jgi:beta-xylosidase
VPFALDRDFADPDVIEVEGTYWAYATQNDEHNVQVATSADLKSWEYVDADALPNLPDWAAPGDTWAPDVAATADGFVMFFTTTSADAGRQCIGVATATRPDGPFEPVGDEPVVCPVEGGGAIDPATFVDDDGARYLLWKNDGNAVNVDTWISIAPLSADGTSLAGEPTRLIQQDQSWEGRLVEAPTLVAHGGAYVLFYSANDYYSLDYAIGYAVADDVLGPYEKAPEPLLSTESSDFASYGPGGQDVVGESIVFHSWSADHTYRGINVAPLEWSGTVPTVVLPRPVD